LHRIFCTWYRLIKHININIWKKRLLLDFPIDDNRANSSFIIGDINIIRNVICY
jgi:hypothetical protein